MALFCFFFFSTIFSSSVPGNHKQFLELSENSLRKVLSSPRKSQTVLGNLEQFSELSESSQKFQKGLRSDKHFPQV